MSERPLSGIRVIEVSSGPMAAIGRQLAELGAHVTQIIPPSDTPGLIQAVERIGKTIETADTRAADGQARVVGALTSTDILIIDTLESALDPIELSEKYPDLIILALSPFGMTGRCKNWKLTEPVIHALSGELSRSGIPDREPLLPPDGVAWGCAASQAVYVTLLSYWNRLRNGCGNLIDFSIFEGASLTLDPGYGIAGSAAAGVPANKQPWGRPEGRQRYPIIPCKDGYVRICVLAKRQWQSMFKFMGEPEQFADPQYEMLHIRFRDPDLIPAIAAFFADKTGDELEIEGEKRGIPIARVYKFEDAIHSAQIEDRKMFCRREILPGIKALTPNGAMEINRIRMSADAPSVQTRAPLTCSLPKSERPLEGLRVLDMGVIVVGAETGRLMADQGAEVIKVENSTFADGMRQNKGDDLVSQTFAAGNRNKKGLGLNLRSPKGIKIFKELVRKSDMVLSNFKAGTMESLGLSYEDLKAINPRIIMTDSSAFGPSGPWSARMGYGPLVRASIGMCDLWRHEGDPEGFGDALTVHPDHLASRIGSIGILSLLIQREQTGKGGRVSVSQAETALNSLGARAAQIDLASQGITNIPMGYEKDAVWGVYPTGGNDEWCAITVSSDEEWTALCKSMAREDLLNDPALSSREARLSHISRIEAALVDWLSQFDQALEAANVLQENGVAAGGMLRVMNIPEFAGFADRNLFKTVKHPYISEDFIQENAPARMSNIPEPELKPAPLIGEHSREILKTWLGLTDESVQSLEKEGVLETWQG